MPVINRTMDSLMTGGVAGGVFGAVTWGIGFAVAAPIGIILFAGTSAAYYFGTAADDTIQPIAKECNKFIDRTGEKVDKVADKVGEAVETTVKKVDKAIDDLAFKANAGCSRMTNGAIGFSSILAAYGLFATKQYVVEKETIPSNAIDAAATGLLVTGAYKLMKAAIG